MSNPIPFHRVARRSLAAVLGLTVCGLCFGDEPAAAKGSGVPAPAIATAIRGLYQQRCQKCHEADGNGTDNDAPDFTNVAWQKSRTDSQLVVSILDGKGSGMPAYRGKISDEQARELTVLTRAFAKGGPVRADDFASRFRELQDELTTLQKQFRELAATTRTASAKR